ncbi:MAG: DEAD/DEAH box helicase [Candidatus Saccharimonadales bacterium]
MDKSREHQDILLEERRRRAAGWLTERVRPAAHVLAEGLEADRPSEIEIREYQLDAWINLWDARQEGKNRALIHLATGLGKTFVAVCDVMKFREEWAAANSDGTTPRILFVSHKNEINEQAAEDFLSVMPDLDIDMFETQRESLRDVDIRFATFQSLLSEKDNFDPQDYEYIIYDEAHHTEAETFREIRDYFDPLFELALTATPRRMDEQDITEYFGVPVYSKDLPEAMAEGLLADVEYHIMLDDAVRETIESGFDPKTLAELYELMRVMPRNEKIADHIRDEQRKQGDKVKTIVFCQDVNHVNAMAGELGAVAYHSKMSKKARRQILKDFRSGKIRTVCTRDMFNEGVNIPDATILAFTRMTGSETIYFQQLGRGLRGRNKKVTVLDFVANVERIAKLRELSETIRRHAEELGDETSESADDEQGGDIGLQVQTSHTEFDFDKLVVDLLEKFNEFSYDPAPEGYLSVKAVARELGISESTVTKIANRLGWELPLFKFYSTVGRGVSPEQLYMLRTEDEVITERATQDFFSLTALGKSLNIAPATLEARIDQMGWELTYRRFGSIIARAISQSQVDELRQRFPDTFLPIIPYELTSVPAAASDLSVSIPTLTKIITEIGWELPRFRARSGNVIQALDTTQIEFLKNHPMIKTEVGQGNAVSIQAAAKELRSSKQRVLEIAAELGIEVVNYRFGSHTTEGLTSAQVELLKTHPYFANVAPEGYISIRNARTLLKVGQANLERVIASQGWVLPEYRFKGQTALALSPSQFNQLAELIAPSAQKAPANYTSVVAFAAELGSTHTTVTKLTRKYGIPVEKHIYQGTQLIDSLSPDSQAALKALPELQRRTAPEGYVSVYSFAKQHGISKHRIDRALKDHQIPTETFHFLNTPGRALSPTSQELLLELLAKD